MKQRWWILIPLILIGLIYGGTRYARWRAGVKANAAAVTYARVRVARGSLSISVDASGTIVSENSAEIYPSRDGEVTKVLVEPGDPVKAGQVLALMDATDADARLRQAQDALRVAQVRLRSAQNSSALSTVAAQRDVDQAKAAVASARAKLDEVKAGPDADDVAQAEASVNQTQIVYDAAKADYDRMKRLFEAQAVTKQQLDAALKTLQSSYESLISVQAKLRQAREPAGPEELAAAESSLAQAQKNLAIAEANLLTAGESDDVPAAEANLRKAQDDLATAREDAAGMKLVAPFDGVVTDVAAVVGTTYVSSKSTKPLVSIAAPGNLVAEVEVNEADITQVEVGQGAEITMDALPDAKFHGRVITVGGLGHVTDGVVCFTVRVAVIDASAKVKPGMSADAIVTVVNRPNALIVPNSAIETRMGRPVVRVYKTGSEVEYRRVTIGLRTETTTEILTGLREGEFVATSSIKAAPRQETENREGPRTGGRFIFNGPPPGGTRR